jgi:hypothetical protein
MNPFGVILGILIVINLVLNIASHNWPASSGWLVAMLEWLRRLM